jgi:hypothetical protein
MLVCGNAGARYATVPVELVRQGTGFGASVGAMEFLEAWKTRSDLESDNYCV